MRNLIKTSRLAFGILYFFFISTRLIAQTKTQPVDYVNPNIGNISHLLVPTYPTISLPNSFLRVYPVRNDFNGSTLNSDFTGSRLKGLPVVSTCYHGSFAFNISPFQGEVEQIKPVISYSFDNEKVTPYSYSVVLDDQGIGVKFAPSHQSAYYEMNFQNKGAANLVINSPDGEMKWNGEAIEGYQVLKSGAKVYLWLETEVKPESAGVLKDGKIEISLQDISGYDAAIVLNFGDNLPVLRLRYGISFIDIAQARSNVKREIKAFDIQPLLENGRKAWNEALGKIIVDGGSENDKVIFFTALYRNYERPVCISEDGRYFSTFDGKVHNDDGIPFFTDDLIWDTYRAEHPLRILIDPKTEENILNSYVRMAGESEHGWMPSFPGIGNNAYIMMNSNHIVASVIDAYQKGLRGFDLEKAYGACKKVIMEKSLLPWCSKPAGELDRFYKEHGYLPALKPGEKETVPEVDGFERRQSVAVTMGTSYDEWCLAQLAKVLGKTDDYNYFLKCSLNYRILFNPKTSFFHPKDKDGEFIQPFNYTTSGGLGARDYYDENTSWTYRWDVQHNIADLINLMGGRENFVANLDSTFSAPLGRQKWEFYTQFPDQTGNVGQFCMGNEPSFHIPYLYNYAGQPWKTQKCVRALLKMWFRNDLMGIPGDEDGGGMSAFVVFSKMGFYPVTAGLPIYNIGSPAFPKSVIKLANGKEFQIIANNCSEENKYIQSAKLNGKVLNKPWFSQDDIKYGAVLELEMDSKPNKFWGSAPEAVPPSESIQK
jgi:predicted alpha-1,2-mannosidase